MFEAWTLVESVVPRFLLGILVATYFQYRGVIEERLGGEIGKLKEDFEKLVNEIIRQLPRHHSIEEFY